MQMDWEAVGRAYEMVAEGLVSRVDGNGWKIYRVNNIVRMDVEDKH